MRTCGLPSDGILKGVGTPDAILDTFKDIFNPPPIEHKQRDDTEKETENVIEVEHLVKAFGSFHAVDDISFTVKKGEIFGFLGANGAGKTTCYCTCLRGLTNPQVGREGW